MYSTVILGLLLAALSADIARATPSQPGKVSYATHPALLATCKDRVQSATPQLSKNLSAEEWQRLINRRDIQECPTAPSFISYVYFLTPQQKNIDPYDVLDFLHHHPHWPNQDALKARFEELVYFDPGRVTQLIEWFDKNPPSQGHAVLVHLQALENHRLTGQGTNPLIAQAAQKAWHSGTFTSTEEQEFLKHYAQHLSPRDHALRVHNLLRDKRYPEVERMLHLLGPIDRVLTKTRLAFHRKKQDQHQCYHPIVGDHANHKGLLHDTLKCLITRKENSMAFTVVKKIKALTGDAHPKTIPGMGKTTGHDFSSPKDLWQDKNLLARRAFEDKDYATAYAIVRDHGLERGIHFAQAEAFAGFTALRYMNNPHQAITHFSDLYTGVSTPMSRSRAAYWLGRAYETVGNAAEAAKSFGLAAQYPATFYGQLAAEKLGLSPSFARFDTRPVSQEAKELLHNDPLANVLLLIDGIKPLAKWQRAFAIAMAKSSPQDATPGTDTEPTSIDLRDYQRAVLQFLTDHAFVTVVYAARAMAETHKTDILFPEAFPNLYGHAFHKNVDPALVLAIIRRESAFDFYDTSNKGARGLMQLMPSTAKMTAKKHKIPVPSDLQLLSNPLLNARVGSAHLADLLEFYDGSYPLAIAAYNAGKNPVNDWLKKFGDPRKGEIDWIDWLESIPYYETRNYVQRVLENVYMYKVNYGKNPMAIAFFS